jgi:hypothetical protein
MSGNAPKRFSLLPRGLQNHLYEAHVDGLSGCRCELLDERPCPPYSSADGNDSTLRGNGSIFSGNSTS